MLNDPGTVSEVIFILGQELKTHKAHREDSIMYEGSLSLEGSEMKSLVASDTEPPAPAECKPPELHSCQGSHTQVLIEELKHTKRGN